MSAHFEERYRASMGALRFPSGDKERLRRQLAQAAQAEREVKPMKKRTLRSAIALAAVLMLMGGIVYAAGTIATMSSGASVADYRYTYDRIDEALRKADLEAHIPEALGEGYRFDRAAVLEVEGADAQGNPMKTWPEIDVRYTGANGARISLSVEAAVNAMAGDREPTEARVVDGVSVRYDRDEYVFLPPDAEGSALPAETQARLDADPHFYVSYGTDAEEHVTYSSASFDMDNAHYLLFGSDAALTAEDLFNMSAAVIGME